MTVRAQTLKLVRCISIISHLFSLEEVPFSANQSKVKIEQHQAESICPKHIFEVIRVGVDAQSPLCRVTNRPVDLLHRLILRQMSTRIDQPGLMIPWLSPKW